MNKLYLLILIAILNVNIAYGAPVVRYDVSVLPVSDNAYDLGTSTKLWRNIFMSGSDGCLRLTGGLINSTGVACGSGGGGGSGGGTWSTTTSTVSGRLINYSNNTTDIVTVGNTATTTGAVWFDPNTLINYFKGKVGIGTTSPYTALSVVGEVAAEKFTATSTTATSTFRGGIVGPNNFNVQASTGWVGIGITAQENPFDLYTTQEAGSGTTIRTAQRTTAILNSNTASGINNGIRGTSGTTYFNGPLDTGTVSGSYQTCINQSTTTGFVNHLYCLVGRSNNSGAGATTKEAAGVYANFSNTAGTTTNGYGLTVESPGISGGMVANYYGVKVHSIASSGSGALGNAYGANIAIPTTGTSTNVGLAIGTVPTGVNNSLHVTSGESYFGGNVEVEDMANIDSTARKILLFDNADVTSQVDFMQVSPTISAVQSSNTYGQRVSFTNSTPAGHGYSDGAILGELIIPNSNANNYTERQSGVYGLFRHYGTGRISEGWGNYSVAGQYGAGPIDNLKAYVAHIYTEAASTGEVNNAYGLYVKRPDNVGSVIGNSYGVFLENQEGIGTSTSYGVYQDGNDTKSVFEGKVAFGYTDPGTARVAINGDVGIGTSSPTNKLTIASTGQTAPSIFGAFRIGQGTNGRFGYMDMVTNPATGNPYFYIQSIHSGTAFRDISLNPSGGNVGVGTTSPMAMLSVNAPAATNSFAIGSSTGTHVLVNQNGSMGIGTVSPSAKLQVVSPTGTVADFRRSALNYFTVNGSTGFFETQSDNNSVPVFTVKGTGTADTFVVYDDSTAVLNVKDGGNVGIGATSPVSTLEVASQTDVPIFSTVYNNAAASGVMARRARGTLASPAALQSNDLIAGVFARGYNGSAFTSSSNGGVYIYAGENWTVGANGTYLGFETTANSGTSRTEKLRITGAGNVGIGTSTPQDKLHVVGGDILIDNNTSYQALTTAGVQATLLRLNNSNVWQGYGNGFQFSDLAGNTFLDIVDQGSVGDINFNGGRVFLKNDGTTGIGTSTPDVRLNVVGSSGTSRPWTRNARTVASFENNTAVGTGISIVGNSSGYSGIFFGDNTAETQGNLRYDHSTDMYRFFTDVSTERFTIAGNTGNVGAGTTSPSARFAIAGTQGGTAPILLVSTSTIDYATSTTLMIDSNGRMGVGTSSPNSLLEVNGSFHVEERTLATSTSMTIDFCNQDTSNNLRMQVGSANIAVTFTNFTSCVGKKITVRVASSDRGLIGSTTFSASTFYWDGYTSPSNNTVNGGMDEFIFDSTMGTSTPFIWGKLNSTLP